MSGTMRKYGRDYLGHLADFELRNVVESLRSQIKYASRKKVAKDKLKLLEIEYCYVQNEVNIRLQRKKSFHNRRKNER